MDIDQRFGHKSLEMIVRVYSHLVDDLKKKEALKIPSLYGVASVDN
jgi:hypothetical protein